MASSSESLRTVPTSLLGQMSAAESTVAQVAGVQAGGEGHRDGLGRAHGRRGFLDHRAFLGPPFTQIHEGGDQHVNDLAVQGRPGAGLLKQIGRLLQDNLDLELLLGDGRHRLEVEAALEGRRHFVDAAIAGVGRGQHVESRFAEDDSVFAAQFGHVQQLVAQHADEGVLNLRRTAGDFLEADHLAADQAVVKRRGNQGVERRSFTQEQGIVPRILDLVLGGAGRPLDGQGAGAGDGGGQQFRKHRLGRTRFADQEQTAIAHESDDGPIDHGLFAVKLAADRLGAVGGRRRLFGLAAFTTCDEGNLTAENEGPHRFGAEFPAGRSRRVRRLRPGLAVRRRNGTPPVRGAWWACLFWSS